MPTFFSFPLEFLIVLLSFQVFSCALGFFIIKGFKGISDNMQHDSSVLQIPSIFYSQFKGFWALFGYSLPLNPSITSWHITLKNAYFLSLELEFWGFFLEFWVFFGLNFFRTSKKEACTSSKVVLLGKNETFLHSSILPEWAMFPWPQ